MAVNKGLILLTALLLVSFAFQFLAVISIPVTQSITLCTYDGYRFGVFGYCHNGVCSDVGVGYSILADSTGFSLPSNARKSISKLLIVHPIATGFTLISLLLSLFLNIRAANQSLNFLMIMLMLILPTFLLTLLSFLVDILLFVPHLDWYGWMLLVSTVLLAVSGSVLCFVRRTVSSRKFKSNNYGQDEQLNNYFNNDNDYTGGFGYRGNKTDDVAYGTVGSVVNDDSTDDESGIFKGRSNQQSGDNNDDDEINFNTTQTSNLLQYQETIPMTVFNSPIASSNTHRSNESSQREGRSSNNSGYHPLAGSSPTRAHVRPTSYYNNTLHQRNITGLPNEIVAPYPVDDSMETESDISTARNNLIQAPKPTFNEANLPNRGDSSSTAFDRIYQEYEQHQPPKQPIAPYPSSKIDGNDSEALLGNDSYEESDINEIPPPLPPHLVSSVTPSSSRIGYTPKRADTFVSVNLNEYGGPGSPSDAMPAVQSTVVGRNILIPEEEDDDTEGTILIVGKKGNEYVGQNSTKRSKRKSQQLSSTRGFETADRLTGGSNVGVEASNSHAPSHNAMVGVLPTTNGLELRNGSFSTQASSNYEQNYSPSVTSSFFHHNSAGEKQKQTIKLEIPPPLSPSTAYSSMAPGMPVSPTESLGSDFTSVSQRGVNPMYLESQSNEIRFIDYQDQPIQNQAPNFTKLNKSNPRAVLQQQLRQPNPNNSPTNANPKNSPFKTPNKRPYNGAMRPNYL